jgi:hypothetical protein
LGFISAKEESYMGILATAARWRRRQQQQQPVANQPPSQLLKIDEVFGAKNRDPV